jgi:hypothetical protein
MYAVVGVGVGKGDLKKYEKHYLSKTKSVCHAPL